MIHTTQEYQIGDNVELMREMPADSIDMIPTSPPYWGLRDYGVDGQIGLEGTLEEYHARLLEVTSECMRVLKPTGVMFWNHGDNYGGSGGSGGDYNEGGLREGHAKVGKNGGLAKCLAMQNERIIIRMIDDPRALLGENDIHKIELADTILHKFGIETMDKYVELVIRGDI